MTLGKLHHLSVPILQNEVSIVYLDLWGMKGLINAQGQRTVSTDYQCYVDIII